MTKYQLKSFNHITLQPIPRSCQVGQEVNQGMLSVICVPVNLLLSGHRKLTSEVYTLHPNIAGQRFVFPVWYHYWIGNLIISLNPSNCSKVKLKASLKLNPSLLSK